MIQRILRILLTGLIVILGLIFLTFVAISIFLCEWIAGYDNSRRNYSSNVTTVGELWEDGLYFVWNGMKHK